MTTVHGMAASVLIAPWIDGPPRRLQIVHRSGSTLSLAGPDRRVAFCVMFPGAVRLPYACAVATSASARTTPSSLSVGDGVLVWGDDGRDENAVQYRVARWWKPARPRPDDHPRLRSAALHAGDGGDCDDSDDFDDSDKADGSDGTDSEVRRLTSTWRDHLGRGPGLTPYADDVLCGALVAMHAVGHPALPRLVEEIGEANLESRTTATSAALLRAACQGWCIDLLADYLQALDRDPDHPTVTARRTALVAVGSSSGHGLLEGVGIVIPDGIPTWEAA